MTESKVCDCALAAEVVSVLSVHDRLQCEPTVAVDDDGVVVLTVRFGPDGNGSPDGALETLELHQALRYLADLCQLRALAQRYDIPAASLEALLPERT